MLTHSHVVKPSHHLLTDTHSLTPILARAADSHQELLRGQGPVARHSRLAGEHKHTRAHTQALLFQGQGVLSLVQYTRAFCHDKNILDQHWPLQ